VNEPLRSNGPERGGRKVIQRENANLTGGESEIVMSIKEGVGAASSEMGGGREMKRSRKGRRKT